MSAEQTARVAYRAPSPIYRLRIGFDRFDVDSLTHASILYQELRDAAGAAPGRWPVGFVEVDGIIYRISNDGRVWDGVALHMEAA